MEKSNLKLIKVTIKHKNAFIIAHQKRLLCMAYPLIVKMPYRKRNKLIKKILKKMPKKAKKKFDAQGLKTWELFL